MFGRKLKVLYKMRIAVQTMWASVRPVLSDRLGAVEKPLGWGVSEKLCDCRRELHQWDNKTLEEG